MILAVAAGVILALGLQARPEDGRPPTYQSVLLVAGLGLLAPALLTLADVLGADFDAFPAGAVTWTSLVARRGRRCGPRSRRARRSAR